MSGHTRRYVGESGDGRCRIEDSENPDAWIEAEYRDGWVERKLMTDDTEAYENMVEPYYLKCQSCYRHDSPQLWGAESPYCPACDQQINIGLPMAMGWMFGDEEPFSEVEL